MSFHDLQFLLPLCLMLHITEEFLFPGGFIEWYQQLVPSKTKGIRPGYLVWINAFQVAVCVYCIWKGNSDGAMTTWLIVAAISAANAIFHIGGVIKLKKYSPGVITGTLLYLPLFVYGTYTLLASGVISWSRVLISLAIGIGYHIFSIYRQAQWDAG
jgi:hypothetical protein